MRVADWLAASVRGIVIAEIIGACEARVTLAELMRAFRASQADLTRVNARELEAGARQDRTIGSIPERTLLLRSGCSQVVLLVAVCDASAITRDRSKGTHA